MKNIIEIWGNGNDVIIKYKKDNMNGIWYAASAWLKVNNPYTVKTLIKNGYRKLKLEEFDKV